MQLDERLTDRQAKPGPFHSPNAIGLRLLERRQHLREMLLGNADAGIGDRHDEVTVSVFTGRNPNLPAGRGEFDRIGEQVKNNLLDRPFVGPKARQMGREAAEDADIALLSPDIDHGQARFNDVTQ